MLHELPLPPASNPIQNNSYDNIFISITFSYRVRHNEREHMLKRDVFAN